MLSEYHFLTSSFLKSPLSPTPKPSMIHQPPCMHLVSREDTCARDIGPARLRIHSIHHHTICYRMSGLITSAPAASPYPISRYDWKLSQPSRRPSIIPTFHPVHSLTVLCSRGHITLTSPPQFPTSNKCQRPRHRILATTELPWSLPQAVISTMEACLQSMRCRFTDP